MQYTEKDRRRFWEKVTRGKVGECWLWQAAVNSSGHGVIGIGGKVRSAHRIAFELTYGPLAEGEQVHQTCGNRLCCNPRHLVGDDRPKVTALWSKGRGLLGELHPQAKLTDATIRRIRERYARGEASQKELADEYGVTQEWIGQVVRGERRASAGGPFTRTVRLFRPAA